ncbi:2-succinyl-5-enolpyruvyl-6-hydroxy-3-cyclohexene-1-carboxylic-acid synthase [Kitasatospora sp. NPDC006697]|uniref:2-succinyl-5-enolpyruvyl-6-hydroxy-3- cyclohexene-1-carboxylic-acid synthase n=1 Tax=Kitasatospora sp. NPDC006697 TaxID=3364020 RepID=UPI0036765E28
MTETIADELARCGVSEVVVSPGLHSAFLANALHRHPGIRLHVRIDERSAGFLALGLARASRRPAAVVCTSGTATANLHPAVLEAHHSRVPLLVLTADRLPAQRDTGANQATDQVRLFGTAVGHFAELDSDGTRADPASVRYWRSVVSRSVAAAARGPVHLNVGLPEPMDVTGEPAGWQPVARTGGAPWTAVTAPAPQPVDLELPARGVVIVGDGAADPDRAVAFAEEAGWPLIAEPQSGARYGATVLSNYVDLLGHPGFRARAVPELVVSVGRPGISLTVLDYLAHAPEVVVVDPSPDWADPVRTATRVVPALGAARRTAEDPAWLPLWQQADKAAATALDQLLDTGPLSEPRVARELVAALPAGALLFVASSMPIRDAERMRPRQDLRILANRGLSGIDGAVSSAVGAALAHQAAGGGRAFALLGDLSLLHDQNGLIGAPGTERPDLVVVLVNNNGGGIFSMLPPGEPIDGFELYLGTPHQVDFAHLAAASGWPYTRARSVAELLSAVEQPGPRLVEVVTDRRANAEFHGLMMATLAEAITATL